MEEAETRDQRQAGRQVGRQAGRQAGREESIVLVRTPHHTLVPPGTKLRTLYYSYPGVLIDLSEDGRSRDQGPGTRD